MTKVFFVRHAEPNYENHDDRIRELSPRGMEDRKKVTAFLADKNIDIIVSSPFKRAVDTVKDFADKNEFIMSQYNSTEAPLIYALITKEEGTNIGYVQLVPIDDGKWEIYTKIA